MGVLSAIGTYATIAAAAVSLASVGYAAAQGAPKIPSTGSASRQIAEAQAAALPGQRALAAAEAQGRQGTVHVPRGPQTVQFVHIPASYDTTPGSYDPTSPFFNLFGDDKTTRSVRYNPADWQEGGKYYGKFPGYDPSKHIYSKKVNVPAHDQTYDFSGYGTADIQGRLARQMADIQTELGRKYGVDFAKEAAHEAELADPEGTAARKQEFKMIEDQIKNPPPINPLSQALESGIRDQLKAGSGLDDISRSLLDDAVTRANAERGGSTQAGDVATSMSTGAEGQARREAGIAKSQAFLSSGSTPEDIAYRREQQNLANLGAFVGGQTPESQFQNLTSVGQGATPFYPGQAPPTQPNNASSVGGPYSVASYQQQLRNAGAGANWMSGIGAALGSLGGTLGKLAPAPAG